MPTLAFSYDGSTEAQRFHLLRLVPSPQYSGLKIPFEKSNFDYLSKSLLFSQDNPQTLLKTIVCILFSHLLTHYGLVYVGLRSSALIFYFASTKSRLFLQCKCSKTGESKYCNTH